MAVSQKITDSEIKDFNLEFGGNIDPSAEGYEEILQSQADKLNNILKAKNEAFSTTGGKYTVTLDGEKFKLSYFDGKGEEVVSSSFSGSADGASDLIASYNNGDIYNAVVNKLQNKADYLRWLGSPEGEAAVKSTDIVATVPLEKASSAAEPTLGEVLMGKVGAWLPIIPLALYGYKTFKSIQSAKKDVIVKDILDAIKTESDLGFFNISASVPLAYKICKLLEENKQTLKKNGINIVGTLGQEKAGTTGMGTQKLASSKLVSSLKQQLKTSTGGMFKKWRGDRKAAGVDSDNITDDQIAQAIRAGLTQICIGLIKMYDKERYKETVKTADKQTFAKESSKWFRSKNYDNIINRIGGEEVASSREKMLQQNVSKEVDILSNFIIGLNRETKGLGEHFYKNSLKDLLFEAKFLLEASNKTIIDVKELKSGLRSSGVLIYSAGLKPDSKDFINGENYLIGTIADFLYTNFDIEVQGVEEYQKLNLTKVAVEADINKDAKIGEPASQELQAIAGNGPVAKDLNSPMNLNQLTSIINLSKGDNAVLLILLIAQKPELLQALVALQGKGGASLLDGLNLIKQEAPEDVKEKLKGIDRDIEQALEYQNNAKPNMAKKDVKRLYKLLNADPLSKLSKINILSGTKIIIKDSTTFVTDLRRYFNITEGSVAYDSDKDARKLVSFIMNNFYDLGNCSLSDGPFYKDKKGESIFTADTSDRKQIELITTLASAYLAIKFLKGSDSEVEDFVKNYAVSSSTSNTVIGNMIYPNIKQANEVLFATLNIPELSAESRFRRSKVITKKPKKLKVIEEAKFLEQEFKRLWNLR